MTRKIRIISFNMKYLEDYYIKALETDELVTDSGKELKLQGNELKRKGV